MYKDSERVPCAATSLPVVMDDELCSDHYVVHISHGPAVTKPQFVRQLPKQQHSTQRLELATDYFSFWVVQHGIRFFFVNHGRGSAPTPHAASVSVRVAFAIVP